MKYPKKTRIYCPKCRSHQDHTVKQEKKRARSSAHPMSLSQRHFKKITAGYGGFPRPKPKSDGKATKKIDLRFKCGKCSKIQIKGRGFRVRKFELV